MSSVAEHGSGFDPMDNSSELQKAASKKKRNLPGTPDPHAEVIALSPRTLMATNRFVCEVCGKGFQRDQNLQLHRRGHNLPWKLKQREDQEIKRRVYVCPEVSCVHHDPSRALGDLTGIKKHFFRKHGDKKWKCEKCSKKYAVQSDWKAHQKVCGTREYRCDCGTLFSRRDSFITHRAFCDALAEESAKISACNPVETSQQRSDPDGNRGTQRVSSALEASSSPFSQLTSGGMDMEVPAREVSRLMTGSEEGGVDSEGLNYGGEMTSQRPNKGPALSLSLGTGPGPGPPGALPMLGYLPLTDTLQLPMNKVLVEESTHWPGMFASMLDSPKGHSETWKGDSSIMNGDSEPWLITHTSLGDQQAINTKARSIDGSFANSALSQFAPPAPSSNNLSSFFGNGYFPSRSSPYHQRHSGSAQLPATALLQKAAMMGATASIPSLFKSYGGDSRPLAPKEVRHDSFLGVGNSLPSSYSSLLSDEKESMGYSIMDSGDGYGAQRAVCSGQGGSSMQELLNSLCNGGAALLQSKPDIITQPAMGNGLGSVHGDNRHHYRMGSSGFSAGGSKYQDGSTLAGLSAGDKNDASRTTLDFLGIGGPSGMAGSTGRMTRTLSQSDIASITTLSAGIKRELATPRAGIVPPRVEGGPSSSMSR